METTKENIRDRAQKYQFNKKKPLKSLLYYKKLDNTIKKLNSKEIFLSSLLWTAL